MASMCAQKWSACPMVALRSASKRTLPAEVVVGCCPIPHLLFSPRVCGTPPHTPQGNKSSWSHERGKCDIPCRAWLGLAQPPPHPSPFGQGWCAPLYNWKIRGRGHQVAQQKAHGAARLPRASKAPPASCFHQGFVGRCPIPRKGTSPLDPRKGEM